MPIRAELRHFYGREWRTITRPRILKRAVHCCEQCGVPNHKVITRAAGWWYQRETDLWIPPAPGQPVYRLDSFHPIIRRHVVIVLTVAHLNHTAGDDRDENLKALCQWCHLNYDKLHHHLTRAARKDAARPLLTPPNPLPTKEANL